MYVPAGLHHRQLIQHQPELPRILRSQTQARLSTHLPTRRPSTSPLQPHIASANAKTQTKAVIAADSRVVVYDNLSQTRAIWIKGGHFTITDLVQDRTVGERWADGAVASYRLSPQDYHRYHSPVEGTVKWWKQIDGNYYQVDPLCLQSTVGVLTKNARCVVCISTREFGDVLFVAIGAVDVGTVK